MRFIIFLVIMLVATSSKVYGQTLKQQPITIGLEVSFASEILKENREVMIYTPNDYDPKKQYQVLYLLDAEFFFIQTVGTVESLVSTGKIPATIIVGLKTTVRTRDYLPSINGEPKSSRQRWIKEKFPQFGKTTEFTNFLTQELFPFIESRYSLKPNRTLVGYSNGGIYGLHTFLSKPDVFTNYLLISPPGWWGEEELDQQFQALSNSGHDLSRNLYLSIAGEGGDFYTNGMRVASNLKALRSTDIKWQFSLKESETHQTTFYPSLYEGLTKLFDDFYFELNEESGKYAHISDIEDYYLKLSKRYEFAVLAPESIYKALADAQTSHKRLDAALVTLTAFVTRYPDSSYAHASLGHGYLESKSYNKALESFSHALQLAKTQQVDDPTVYDYFESMIAQAKSKIVQ
ncbi:esterase [Pseudoalteromonas sp. McH1-7]|uniref:alpha/beta hydrolase-fold protein n=1 Tax=Pseudoalteromonas sp. McH1-7 TaxID=2745574 RepID=UPI00159039B3|nr:alpha/beta hydrolase-fold protein [Pseudoalteromonas sp. McH1-7]NUZ11026.1 esterase [Pseudoalteromonas sp. McH1-7]